MERVTTVDGAPERLIVDVRDAAAFATGHLAGSGHVPAPELDARRAELPPRGAALLVVADDGDHARAAATRLETMGYDVAWLDAAVAAHLDGRRSRAPAVRLWRPAPFLEEMLDRLPRGRALDVAAGAGRDAVFLALSGWDVAAWDHDAEALERANALARRHGVTIATVVANLENPALALPRGAFELVTCFRFLHRPLLPRLEAALAPGGVLVYETFRLGQERFGRPLSRRHLLASGELASAFPSLVIEHYAELEPAGGPITARVLARRPAR